MISIHYYSLSQPPEILERLFSTLSQEEKQKALRFTFKSDVQTAILSRGILRILLSEKLRCHPSDLTFHYTPTGKPFLPPNKLSQPLYFNVSHSGGIVLFGISENRDIGVDIEYHKEDSSLSDLAENHFHPAEWNTFGASPLSIRQEVFYSIWTRKEAYLKGTGEGIAQRDLRELNLSLSPTFIDCDDSPFSFWKVLSNSAIKEYSAAIAFPVRSQSEEISINCFTNPPSKGLMVCQNPCESGF